MCNGTSMTAFLSILESAYHMRKCVTEHPPVSAITQHVDTRVSAVGPERSRIPIACLPTCQQLCIVAVCLVRDTTGTKPSTTSAKTSTWRASIIPFPACVQVPLWRAESSRRRIRNSRRRYKYSVKWWKTRRHALKRLRFPSTLYS
jgi:hypothetical protein